MGEGREAEGDGGAQGGDQGQGGDAQGGGGHERGDETQQEAGEGCNKTLMGKSNLSIRVFKKLGCQIPRESYK